jgi:putative transposase
MNAPKFSNTDYIDFLIASPRTFTCTEAARVQPTQSQPVAHDAITRLLHRQEADRDALWQEARTQIRLACGILVVDDSTLDKHYSRHIELVCRHWSGKHRRVVCGINLISLLWTDGDRHVPIDWRVYDKPNDNATKNDHFRAMLQTARARGFAPVCVAFDSWYGSLANLKQVRDCGWTWLTQFKANRLVNPDDSGNQRLDAIDLGAGERIVHLKGYGFVKIFKIVPPDGDIEYWASNDLSMNRLRRVQYAGFANNIEQYHRGIKQFCGVERCQARRARAQRHHIELSLRAFLRLESYCFHAGISWFEAKTQIAREAVRAYIAYPLYHLVRTA